MISTIRKAYSYNSIRLVRHLYKDTQIGSQTSHLSFLLQEKLFNYPTLVNTLRLFSEIEMEVSDVMRRLEFRASRATEIIELLDRQIREVKKAAIAQSAMSEETRLKEENAVLKAEIEMWKQRLIKAELKNGVKQFHNFCLRSDSQNTSRGARGSQKTEHIFEKKGKFKETKKTNEKKEIDNKSTKSGPSDERSVDVSRLDFRVGKIISAKKHPDADSLYVEEIDLGEGKNRTVVSGLVKFVPIEQMQNRIVVLLCNLKPAKMRGIVSEAMVMCASTPDKVEILSPPEDAVPGDRVICEEYPGDPDKELNPKKKIFEQVAPDLKTDEEKRATYKGKLLIIPGKGNIIAQSLLNVQIK